MEISRDKVHTKPHETGLRDFDTRCTSNPTRWDLEIGAGRERETHTHTHTHTQGAHNKPHTHVEPHNQGPKKKEEWGEGGRALKRF